MTFDDVLQPLTRTEFVAKYLGERWLRITGQPGRFAQLAPWEQISAALSHHRFTGARLRLVKTGHDILKEDYFLRPDAEDGSPIETRGLLRHLREGATLVINGVDDFLPVRSLVEELEEIFRINIAVNLYAGWKTDNGFDLHWDAHDTLILQISGRKHWRVYEPTRLHPFKKDEAATPQPTADPVWDGEMRDGDVLYMPRGWWHVAFPMNEPSLHLTVGMGHMTGFELMQWFAQLLKSESLVRADVPHLASEEARRAYATELAELVRKRITPEALDAFMNWSDGKIIARPQVTLPVDVNPKAMNLEAESVVRLTADRRLQLTQNGTNGVVHFKASGEDWNCDTSLVPALSLLRGHRGTPLQVLADAVPRSERSALRLMLTVMAAGGAIVISRA